MRFVDCSAMFCFTGTTWTQEIVYLLMNGGDVAEARSRDINDRFPFIELHEPGQVPWVDTLAARPGRRLIKSHLGPEFFGKCLRETNAKIIICMRNIKDNLASFYHFYETNSELGNFRGSFSEFLKLAEKKKLIHGDWFDFNLGWWRLRHNPNILFLKFEDLVQHLPRQVERIAEFIGKRYSAQLINTVCKNVDFSVMKRNPAVNRLKNNDIGVFMRKGRIGDWRNYFSPEESAIVDEVCATMLKATGLTFDYDLPQERNQEIRMYLFSDKQDSFHGEYDWKI